MCNCQHHVRLWEETHGGKYPPSQHAPSCEDYRQEPFTRLEYDGVHCVMEPHEAEVALRDADDPEGYKVSTVMLTRDQFDAMEDFRGF